MRRLRPRLRCCLPLVLAAGLCAQKHDEHTASVGMRARIDELVLPGSELVAAPTTMKAPMVLRVLATRAHGDAFRYDLEWCGLEPGQYDLATCLARKDGSPLAGLPPVPVTVTSTLKKGELEPSEIDPKAPPRLNGYSTEQVVVGVLWVLGLLAILFVGRKWRRALPPAVRKPSLADRLRPLVEAVAAGAADDAGKAELERLLLAFWRARLGLRQVKAEVALAEIRRHAEAGVLLRQLEAWLHMPAPPAVIDVPALLAPYASVSAESFDEPAAAAEAS